MGKLPAYQIREDSWITSSWYYVDNLGRPQPQPDSYGDGTSEYDNSTRTVTMLFSRLLSCPGNVECNAFQMRGGERWVMGFILELKFPTNGLVPQQDYGYVDGWPQEFLSFPVQRCFFVAQARHRPYQPAADNSRPNHTGTKT